MLLNISYHLKIWSIFLDLIRKQFSYHFTKEEIYLNCKTTCEKNTYCTLLNVAKNLINKLILNQFAQY